MTTWYRTGTVNVTVNSVNVVGVGTAFLENVKIGDEFNGPDGRSYEITNVATNTSITLATAYKGATATAQAYQIKPTQGWARWAALKLAELMSKIGDAIQKAAGALQIEQYFGEYDTSTKKGLARAGLGLGTAAVANLVDDNYDTTEGRVLKTSPRFNQGWQAIATLEGGRWAKIAEVTGGPNERATIFVAGGVQGYGLGEDTVASAILSLAFRNPSENELQVQLTTFGTRGSVSGITGLATVKTAYRVYEVWLKVPAYTRVYCSSFGGLRIQPISGTLQVDAPANMNDWSTSIHRAYTTGNLLPVASATDTSPNKFVPANMGWGGLMGAGINQTGLADTEVLGDKGHFFYRVVGGSTPSPYPVNVIGVNLPGVGLSGRFAMGNASDRAFMHRRLANGSWSPIVEFRTTANTTVDSNGFIKTASPIIHLFNGHFDSTDHLELKDIELMRVGVGHYELHNAPLLSRDGWYIETPKDRNGNVYFTLDYEEHDGVLTIRTYTPDYSEGPAKNGQPVDILDGRFVSLRFAEDPSLYPEPEPEPEIEPESDPEQEPEHNEFEEPAAE